jgi:predicted Zn-dependent protease
MAGDFSVAEGITFGELVHAHLHRSVVFERDGWAVERVDRVSGRLQAGRSVFDTLYVEVPWVEAINAFTLPGRYVYFCRRLLERCPDDETAAFVIGHEIAHHDLGHMALFPHWMGRATRRWGGLAVILAMEGIERRLYGPERECDADRRGLELCITAGYDPQRCLRWFPIMEQIALDFGDQSIVYGPSASDQELSPDASLATKARIWAWQRTRGYLPLQDRHAALKRYLETRPTGTQPP